MRVRDIFLGRGPHVHYNAGCRASDCVCVSLRGALHALYMGGHVRYMAWVVGCIWLEPSAQSRLILTFRVLLQRAAGLRKGPNDQSSCRDAIDMELDDMRRRTGS